MIRTYAELEPRLRALHNDILDQAAKLDLSADDLEGASISAGERPPAEKINILRRRADTLGYKAQVVFAAADICGGRGTAAETAGMSYVLPPWVEVAEALDGEPEPDGEPMRGRDLRMKRESLGVTQAALGDMLGVSRNTIARWERGELTIQHPRVLRLALKQFTAAGIKPIE
ncbi:MAG: helix-turn-helix transcriptional regulator [Chloroflexota bacterium]